ncbi:hypothetical protein CMALT430_80012 [Carnobacterium maltaromaticum]|uniref:hypothetical protein n=1 Tax=Carnobacterium maltaromaticum TaxID=2751 RepID=UPI00191BB284|nr:hypothetical protein [Carnobacterium maltaromaticum]CAD5902060.1 hypothetical protein CMALT430_80012 [Carnobacterium maltaromaticum]
MKRKSIVVLCLTAFVITIVIVITYLNLNDSNKVKTVILDKNGQKIKPIKEKFDNYGY